MSDLRKAAILLMSLPEDQAHWDEAGIHFDGVPVLFDSLFVLPGEEIPRTHPGIDDIRERIELASAFVVGSSAGPAAAYTDETATTLIAFEATTGGVSEGSRKLSLTTTPR